MSLSNFKNVFLGFLYDCWKTIYKYVICFVAGISITLVIVLPACSRRINRADIEIATIRAELSRTTEEFERAGTTISELRRIQYEITEGLVGNNSQLHSIIERLYLIRDKVQDIENELDDYYSHNNSDNNNNSNNNNQVDLK